jgi:hypothetical protein
LHPAFFGGVRFRDVREFLRKYKGMVNQERGECTCETDEIETGTIDGSGVIFGTHVPRGRGFGPRYFRATSQRRAM